MAREVAYEAVAAALRAQILDGTYTSGAKLPSEESLRGQFGVSRNTIRLALDRLEVANLVKRRRGSGTYVSSDTGISHSLGSLRSFTDVMTDLGLVPGISHVEVRIDPAPPGESVGLFPSERVWLVRRVRTGSGTPFSLLDSWVPERLGALLDPGALDRRQSLYRILAEDHDVVVAEATESIHAEAATPYEAEVLEVPVGSPLIVIRRWTYDRNGRPVEYTRGAGRGDQYRYVVKLRA